MRHLASRRYLGVLGLGLMLVGGRAHADDKARALELSNLLGSIATDGTVPDNNPPFRFGFQVDSAVVDPDAYPEAEGATGRIMPKKTVIAYTADKSVAWIASDLVVYDYCGAEECQNDPPLDTVHGTMLVEVTAPMHPVAFHIGSPVTGKAQAKAVAAGGALPALAPQVDDGADAAVALFQASLADPKAMVASVSARKDVVLYGSSAGERWVGGAAVKAQLKKWGLGMTLLDGIQAGVTTGGGVAWVAANVSARAIKRPKDKAMPYRVLFLYERVGGAWQLVQASFSYVLPRP